jgi:hypothetical protein
MCQIFLLTGHYNSFSPLPPLTGELAHERTGDILICARSYNAHLQLEALSKECAKIVRG